MSDKPPNDNDGLLEFLKQLWLPVAGFLGAITLAYNFYQLWLGDQATVTYFLTGGGLIVLIISLLWMGFGYRTITRDAVWPIGTKRTEKIPVYSSLYQKVSRIVLAVVILGLTFGGRTLIVHRRALEEKLVVVIAAFDGPEDVYGLHSEIIEKLNADFSSDGEVVIVPRKEVITPNDGSSAARALGKRYLADVVIWGWYRPTGNPNITLHIENLAPKQLLLLEESKTLQPPTTLIELNSFSFQQQAGKETSALISFLGGYIEFQTEHYDVAIERFDDALEKLKGEAQIFEALKGIYFYRASSKLLILELEQAIQDFDKAIELDPQDAIAFGDRGLAYQKLGEHERAIQDFDKAIELDPQFVGAYIARGDSYLGLSEYDRAIHEYDKVIQLDPQFKDAYINRGVTYQKLGDYKRAIQDFDKVIQLDPQFKDAYINRGVTYYQLGEYERAIQDYDKAIELDPQFKEAYYDRGGTHYQLGEYERAIQDYDKAIELDPQFQEAYSNRGGLYGLLDEYERAIQDYDKAIEINPQDADVYRLRGLLYVLLDKTTEAEADFKKYEELTGQKP